MSNFKETNIYSKVKSNFKEKKTIYSKAKSRALKKKIFTAK